MRSNSPRAGRSVREVAFSASTFMNSTAGSSADDAQGARSHVGVGDVLNQLKSSTLNCDLVHSVRKTILVIEATEKLRTQALLGHDSGLNFCEGLGEPAAW